MADIHKDIDSGNENSSFNSGINKTRESQLDWLKINANGRHFVFSFGNKGTGKTMLLGSILHWIMTGKNRYGTYTLVNQDNKEASTLEQVLRNLFMNQRLADRTTKLVPLHIKFTPIQDERNLPPIDVVFIEAAGEDHQKVYITNNNADDYPNELTDFIEHKGISMLFLLVASYKNIASGFEGNFEGKGNIDRLMSNFINYAISKNRDLEHNSPFFALVLQWDAYHAARNDNEWFLHKKETRDIKWAEYRQAKDDKAVDDFMQGNLTGTFNWVKNQKKGFYGAYSIGEVNPNFVWKENEPKGKILDTYDYYPEQLWKHIYEKFSGRSLDEDMPIPPKKPLTFFEKIKKTLES